jgi:hypothetical protein
MIVRELNTYGGAILMDINEEWLTGRKYLSMDKE